MADKPAFVTNPTPKAPTSISSPSLPTSSGAWWGNAETICRKDTSFVEQHRKYLKACTGQADALNGLILARVRVAKTLVELSALPELCRREQTHRLRVLQITQETEATLAATALANARADLQRANGSEKAPQPPPMPSGVTLEDIESVAQNMPELSPESIRSLLLALNGLMSEKTA